MKTGDKYFRYGQTGIRPEDFTGPCPQCTTECFGEITDIFNKFNFWSFDTGEIGEKTPMASTSSPQFTVGGGYTAGDVVAVKNQVRTYFGDIRIQFEDGGELSGSLSAAEQIKGCDDSSSAEQFGLWSRGREFAKYNFSIIYQHLFGEFSNPPTEDEIQCYCTWLKTYNKRVSNEQDITLGGCQDCIASDEGNEMKLVDVDTITGTIYQNMINTATTVETISIFAPVDIFSFFPVCGELVVEESHTFDFDHLEEIKDSSGDDSPGETEDGDGEGDGEEDLGGGGAELGGEGDGDAGDVGGDPDNPDDNGDTTEDDPDDEEDEDSEDEKSYNRYKGEGFFLFVRSKCESIDGSQEFEISGTSKHPHIIGSHPTRRAGHDQNSQGRYFHNTQYKKELGVQRQTRFTKIGEIYHTVIHEAGWGEAMVNQPGDGGKEYWTTIDPMDFQASRSYPKNCDEDEDEGSLAEAKDCCKFCKEELAVNEEDEDEEPNENANGIACGVLEFPKLPEEHYYNLVPCSTGFEGECKQISSFGSPFVKRASDFCEQQKQYHFESAAAAIEGFLEDYKEKEFIPGCGQQSNIAGHDGSVTDSFGNDADGFGGSCGTGTGNIACGTGILLPFSRNEVIDPETDEPTGEYGNWGEAYVHDFPVDAIHENCSEQNREIIDKIVGVCKPVIHGNIAMTDKERRRPSITNFSQDDELRIHLHAQNDSGTPRNNPTDFATVGHRIKGGDGDAFELTKLDYLINNDILVNFNTGSSSQEFSSQGFYGGRCGTHTVCDWYGNLTESSNSNSGVISGKGIDQLIGITFYTVDVDSMQTQTGTTNVPLKEIYQKVFTQSLNQIPEDVGKGGFDSTTVEELVKDWYFGAGSGAGDAVNLVHGFSAVEYIYKAHKAGTYLYANDPFLVGDDTTYYDHYGNTIGAGLGADTDFAYLSGRSLCGKVMRKNPWTGEEEEQGCYDVNDMSIFGHCGHWPYVSRNWENCGAGVFDSAVCAPYELRVEGSCWPMDKVETCNEGSLEFFVGQYNRRDDIVGATSSFYTPAPPYFDTGQRIFDCDIIVDDVFSFPTDGFGGLNPNSNIIKRCIYDEDDKVKDSVPEEMVCIKEDEEGEEVKEICAKDNYIYVIHRENIQQIFPAPMKPPIVGFGNNAEDLGKIGANGKRCWEQFPEPEDKYVYACGTKMYFSHKFDEDAFDEAGNLKDTVSDPDQYIPIGGNWCTETYPLATLRTVDDFDLNLYHCSRCAPDYEAECVYKKDADGNDTDEVALCKMKCAGSEQFDIAAPWLQQFGGPDMPGTCCDVCMDTDDPPDNQLDTCLVTYYVCGEESSPHKDGYVWYRGLQRQTTSGNDAFDEFGNECMGECFGNTTGGGRTIDACCALNVKCNIIPVDVGSLSKVEIDKTVKPIASIPLEIKLH